MAAYVTYRTGNVNVNSSNPISPWYDGGAQTALAAIPGAGDTVTLGNGYQLTNPAGYFWDIGLDSGADNVATPAIQSNGTAGTGTLLNLGTLRYRGPIRIGEATWESTGMLEHGGTAVSYSIQIGRQSNTTAKLKLTGSGKGASRSILRKATGAVNAGTIGSGLLSGGGQVEAVWAKISDIGSASVDAFRITTGSNARTWSMTDTLIDNCGIIYFDDSFSASSHFLLRRTTTRGCLHASFQFRFIGIQTPTTGTRVVDACYIEGGFRAASSAGHTGLRITNTVFATLDSRLPTDFVGGAAGSVLEWHGNWLHATGNGQYTALPGAGTVEYTICIRDGATSIGPYGCAVSTARPEQLDINDLILYTNLDAGTGDMFKFATHNPTATKTVNVRRLICLPGPGGRHSGTALQMATGAPLTMSNLLLRADHCTVFVSAGEDGSVTGGGVEGAITFPVSGQIQIKNCIGVKPANCPDAFGHLVVPGFAGTPVNTNAWDCHHNAVWNLSTPYHGDPSQYLGGAGANDVVANPQFVDATRNPLTWAQTIDPTITTLAQVRQRWSTRNDDAELSSAWSITDCVNWIREGMAPTNAALKGTAADGLDLGAVPVLRSAPNVVGGMQAGGNFVF